MEQHDRFIQIGEIVGTHGIRGALKMVSFAESMEHFSQGDRLKIKSRDGRSADFTIVWAKPHKRVILLTLEGIANLDACQALIGARVLIRKEALPDTEEGEYYWFDLIGLSVYTLEDVFLGRLIHVMPTGGNDVYIVQNGKSEVLIPAVESVIREVDLENKRMRVELPEGL